MKTLIDVLALYAAENLVPCFQKDTAAQTRAAYHKADQLTGRLEALSPEAAQWMDALKTEQLTVSLNQERAVLLAGISIGLELGRL
ncbi:hypothetical protein AALA83_05410 [Oscillospiraceae bacterium 44-5]|jgi:hypothetical protein|uniref:hypothetical protein n=1 Tax=Lawsonibacter sp. JLR.KK007 TaxID=3114293 RepID=UPI002FF0B63C